MYNLAKPMSYREFCIMPTDIRIEYLTKLRDEFGVNMHQIAEMMGTSFNALTIHKTKHLDGKPFFGRRSSAWFKKEAWEKFCAGETEESKEPVDVNTPLAFALIPSDVSPNVCHITNGSLTFNGKPADIFTKMLSVLDINSEYMITVSFNKVNSER